ncbi:MAG TPA: cytochrome b N-terminal domain-containing protein [Solirubrobacteraceae bacterium]|nr:cytochrome b N-terminal domain-containing protein [Solirubrobacteraceae bacterium]
MMRGSVRWIDERLGLGPTLRSGLRYVFPDHWSFMLGEIALYAFIVLIGTGVFISFYYIPTDALTTYRGSYEPLAGLTASENFISTVRLSFDVSGGLLMRQAHHWAANVFIVAIIVHLARVVYTGAFRKPREINYFIGVSMLGLALFDAFTGYMLPDDLLSGMGLIIAYAVGLGIPFVGEDLMFLAFDGPFPGSDAFWNRLEITHVLLVPLILGALISLHLAIIVRQHHAQFSSGSDKEARAKSEKQVVGSPMWPGYALRSLGLMALVVGLVFLLGGLVQINPVWLWGPYEPYLASNGAQPDWYLGWLIGALRLMPAFEPQIGDYTLVPNAFWGGALFPIAVFAVFYMLPVIEKRYFGGDRRKHNVLDRPRDNPRRTAFLTAFFFWIWLTFVAGATDQLFFRLGISYEGQVWFFRFVAVLGPFAIYFIVRRWAEELRERDVHPLRGWNGRLVRHDPATGGFVTLDGGQDGAVVPEEDGAAHEPDVGGPREERATAAPPGPDGA